MYHNCLLIIFVFYQRSLSLLNQCLEIVRSEFSLGIMKFIFDFQMYHYCLLIILVFYQRLLSLQNQFLKRRNKYKWLNIIFIHIFGKTNEFRDCRVRVHSWNYKNSSLTTKCTTIIILIIFEFYQRLLSRKVASYNFDKIYRLTIGRNDLSRRYTRFINIPIYPNN